MLIEEFDETCRSLEGPAASSITVGSENLPVRAAVIPTITIDEAIRSGLFENNEAKHLTILSLAEYLYNAKLQHYLAFLVAGSGSETNVRSAVTNLEVQRKYVLSMIPEIKKEIKNRRGSKDWQVR